MTAPVAVAGPGVPALKGLVDPVLAGLFGLALVVWPVYLLPSGYPQPVSVILVLAFTWLLVRCPTSIVDGFRRPELPLIGAFVAYSLVVNLMVSIANQDSGPLYHSFYYFQVLLACLVLQYLLVAESGAMRVIYYSTVASLAIQGLLLAVAGGSTELRETGYLANPNQLGFYSLLSLGLLLLLYQRLDVSWISMAVGASIATALALFSLSKAAIVSVVVLLVLDGIFAPARGDWSRRIRPLRSLIVPAVLIALVVVFRHEIVLIGDVMDRLADIGSSRDDSLGGRGYTRILDRPEFTLLGAGEGLLQRWNQPYEIHSMFGTLLFSYGLPGLGIVLALLAIVLRRSPRDFFIYVVPVLLYSLTHHPMRQWMMWGFLLVVAWVSPLRGRFPETGR